MVYKQAANTPTCFSDMLAAAGGNYLPVITDCTAFDGHTKQSPAVALTDLDFEVLMPAIVAVCMTALHGGRLRDRHIREATATLNISRGDNCSIMGVAQIAPGQSAPGQSAGKQRCCVHHDLPQCLDDERADTGRKTYHLL